MPFHPSDERTTSCTKHLTTSVHLAVAPEREGVVPLPRLPPASSGLVVSVSLAQATALLAGSGETTALAVLVDRLHDPVYARVATDSLVVGVDKNHLVVLVGRILVDPVRVQHTQVGATAANALLGSRLERTLVFELVDTLVGRLACCIVRYQSKSRRVHPAYHK
jgi:hypothetical protein